MNNTTPIPSGKDIQRKWFVLDAAGKTLGRLSTQAASILAGKEQCAVYAVHRCGRPRDCGELREDCADRVEVGQEAVSPVTGFPGGLREESFVKLLARRPEAIVEQSIKGMLPKSKMGRQMATKLKVYKGPHHPHLAQQPIAIEGKA